MTDGLESRAYGRFEVWVVASKSYHKSVSMFWALGVPAILFAVVYYAYRTPSWLGTQVQRALGPILDPILRFVDRAI